MVMGDGMERCPVLVFCDDYSDFVHVSCFRPMAVGDGMERHNAPGSHGDHSGQSFLSKVAAGWFHKIKHEKMKREKRK